MQNPITDQARADYKIVREGLEHYITKAMEEAKPRFQALEDDLVSWAKEVDFENLKDHPNLQLNVIKENMAIMQERVVVIANKSAKGHNRHFTSWNKSCLLIKFFKKHIALLPSLGKIKAGAKAEEKRNKSSVPESA